MQKSKYKFFLNPYVDVAFTKCPKCETVTKLRKFCLMIHYKDEKSDYHQLLSLNKTCKFCPSCELIITKKSEIESYLEEMLTRWGKTTFHAENYLVFGTIDRSVWKAGKQNSLNPQDALKLAAPFKHVWEFKVTSPGWYFDGEK